MQKSPQGADLSTLKLNKNTASLAAIKYAPKTAPITPNEALKTGKMFATLVRSSFDENATVYVFGSTIQGNAHNQSDIDIAVISEKYSDFIEGYIALDALATNISPDIEIHAISHSEWLKDDTPHIYEIRNGGVAV
jgi:predicted nucleotidyltransferase